MQMCTQHRDPGDFLIKVTGGSEIKVLTGAAQKLNLPPRADTKSHFWHPKADAIPHFDSPGGDK